MPPSSWARRLGQFAAVLLGAFLLVAPFVPGLTRWALASPLGAALAIGLAALCWTLGPILLCLAWSCHATGPVSLKRGLSALGARRGGVVARILSWFVAVVVFELLILGILWGTRGLPMLVWNYFPMPAGSRVVDGQLFVGKDLASLRLFQPSTWPLTWSCYGKGLARGASLIGAWPPSMQVGLGHFPRFQPNQFSERVNPTLFLVGRVAIMTLLSLVDALRAGRSRREGWERLVAERGDGRERSQGPESRLELLRASGEFGEGSGIGSGYERGSEAALPCGLG